MPARDLYRYVWHTSRSKQLVICLLTMVVAPLSMVVLELQRRIVDDAVGTRSLTLLAVLCTVYVAVLCLRTALKYVLDMFQGAAVEAIARDLRLRIMTKASSLRGNRKAMSPDEDRGTVVSLLGAETENMSGFAGDAFSLPLLQGGTIFFVVGYLLWIQPLITIVALVVYFPQAVVVPLVQRTINRLAQLRIVLARNLGNLAVRDPGRQHKTAKRPAGGILIDRLYRIRIWIYLRKYFLSELGNFLDGAGPIIVLGIGGYLAIRGETQVSTLVVFISGLQKISDPWDQIVNFYRTISNTAVMYAMIRDKLEGTPANPPRAEAAPGMKDRRRPARPTDNGT